MITIDELKEAIKKGFIKVIPWTLFVEMVRFMIMFYQVKNRLLGVSREELLENVINELG